MASANRVFLCTVVSILLAPELHKCSSPALALCASGVSTALEDLLSHYKDNGLPLPNKEAKLVVSHYYVPEENARRSFIAFQLKPGTKISGPTLLNELYTHDYQRPLMIEEIEPSLANFKKYEPHIFGRIFWAIQCFHCGWNDSASYLYESSIKEDRSHATKAYISRSAWHYWCTQLSSPTIDRKPIAAKLKSILSRIPELNTPNHQLLLQALENTFTENDSNDPVEKIINKLVDCTMQPPSVSTYWQLVDKGFDAIPSLINHLNDNRLTRAEADPGTYLCVRNVVGSIIETFADQNLDREIITPPNDVNTSCWIKKDCVTEKAAREWWVKAQRMGEEAYMLNAVNAKLNSKSDLIEVEYHLRVIFAKYPHRIPDLYREVLEKYPDKSSDLLSQALLTQKISDQYKMKIYAHAMENKNPAHRYNALRAIRNIDKHEFDKRTSIELDKIPEDIKGSYTHSPEVAIAELAIETDSQEVWQKLDNSISRSKIGMKVEILSRFGNKYATRNRQRILKLMRGYLGEAAIWDSYSIELSGRTAACEPYRKIEVRNFIAVAIGKMLYMEIEDKPDRTLAEWATIRMNVTRNLANELTK